LRVQEVLEAFSVTATVVDEDLRDAGTEVFDLLVGGEERK
jgi:hypothetical protein